MLLELADHLLLVGGERVEPGAERSQLGVGLAFPAPHRHQLSILDVTDARATNVIAHRRAWGNGSFWAAPQRDGYADQQPAA